MRLSLERLDYAPERRRIYSIETPSIIKEQGRGPQRTLPQVSWPQYMAVPSLVLHVALFVHRGGLVGFSPGLYEGGPILCRATGKRR